MIRGQYVEHDGTVWQISDVSSHRGYTAGLAHADITYTLHPIPDDGRKVKRLANPTAEQIKLHRVSA